MFSEVMEDLYNIRNKKSGKDTPMLSKKINEIIKENAEVRIFLNVKP